MEHSSQTGPGGDQSTEQRLRALVASSTQTRNDARYWKVRDEPL